MDLLKSLNNMITAEEFLNKDYFYIIIDIRESPINPTDISRAMIEFAKLQAVEILKKLSKTEMEYQRNIQYVYPLSNIK